MLNIVKRILSKKETSQELVVPQIPLSTMPFDWPDEADVRKLSSLQRRFSEDGYLILQSAVQDIEIDRLLSDIRMELDHKHRSHLLFQEPGSGKSLPLADLIEKDQGSVRMVDLYVQLESARRVLLAPKVVEALKELFSTDIKLFQSLSFIYGSQQGLHQDTAYVVTEPPLNLVGVWVALEDVTPGSGELMYVEGSHKLPLFFYEKTRRVHWDRSLDGDALHVEYGKFLLASANSDGRIKKTFLPKKGDVLVWHAQLAHGGSPRSNDNTRQSIVGHFCPANTHPNWMRLSGESQYWSSKDDSTGTTLVSQYYQCHSHTRH